MADIAHNGMLADIERAILRVVYDTSFEIFRIFGEESFRKEHEEVSQKDIAESIAIGVCKARDLDLITRADRGEIARGLRVGGGSTPVDVIIGIITISDVGAIIAIERIRDIFFWKRGWRIDFVLDDEDVISGFAFA